jgi:DNA helicase IV
LVVGPNNAFLHYIGQVLPSLGEGGIEQQTVDGLLARVPQADESAEVAVLKGDARMAEVLRRAVITHIAKPSEDVVAVVGTKRYRVPAHHLRRYVDDARRALGTELRWNSARERIRLQIAEDVRRQREDAGGAPSDAETAKVARTPGVRRFLDEVWPVLAATDLLRRLYRDPAFLRRCSATTLSDEERDLLARPDDSGWTAADVVLLDELDGILDSVPTYVHAVVDEAQDLSAMQCRAISRRCPLGSVTVLGDLAQATTAWATGRWDATLEHLGHPGAAVRALTVGYRVPGEVLEFANRLLPFLAKDVPAAESVRHGADTLRFAGRGGLVDEVNRCLAVPGSLGVIAPDAAVALVAAELAAADVPAQMLDDERDARVTVVPASAAKGLEFDSVVVVEPADVVAQEPTRTAGLRRLYVALTRAVSRLTVLSDQPLPAELTR